jgi:hypothetical protein
MTYTPVNCSVTYVTNKGTVKGGIIIRSLKTYFKFIKDVRKTLNLNFLDFSNFFGNSDFARQKGVVHIIRNAIFQDF